MDSKDDTSITRRCNVASAENLIRMLSDRTDAECCWKVLGFGPKVDRQVRCALDGLASIKAAVTNRFIPRPIPPTETVALSGLERIVTSVGGMRHVGHNCIKVACRVGGDVPFSLTYFSGNRNLRLRLNFGYAVCILFVAMALGDAVICKYFITG